MTGTAQDNTLSRIIDLASVADQGARFTIEPTEAERAAIARRLDVPSIDRLRGEFAVTPARGGASIILNLTATVGRICVASLEPMSETIDEEIRMSFERNFKEDDEADDETEILREPLEGDEIDLGELLVQHLSLSLAPHPRKEGAENLAGKYRDATSSSPFDALKGLAKRDS